MSETKWTPGPWYVKRCSAADPGSACRISSDPTDTASYEGIMYDASHDECHHLMSLEDATLMAHSPALYEALTEAGNIIACLAAAMDVRAGNSDCSDGCIDTLKAYGRLLAKARGEA